MALYIYLFIITEQAAQLICSGKKKRKNTINKDKFSYVITKLRYNILYSVCSPAEKESKFVLSYK